MRQKSERELAIGRIYRLMLQAWELGGLEEARHYEGLLTKYENMTDQEFYDTYIRENSNVSI